ncbi:MAG TPA: SAF domain-containing protein [Anaerolineales bacterium]
MRLGKLLIVFAVVLILGLVALYAVLNLNAGEQAAESGPQTTDIVVVTQPIPRGSLITDEALGMQAIPTTDSIGVMFTDKNLAIGRVARYDLEPGVPLMTSMIADTSAGLVTGGSDTALLIPSGMVAFPIPIDRFSSLAYGLRAGDHVNVIATLLLVEMDSDFQTILPNNTAALLSPGDTVATGGVQAEPPSSQLVVEELINSLTAQTVSGGAASPVGNATFDETVGQPFYQVPSEAQRPRLVSQTLIQDITVLHVGNFFYTDERGEEVPNSIGAVPATDALASIPQPPDLITLIVTPQDAVTLNYLVYAGAELSLALRSAADSTVATTEAVTLEYLLNTYNIPVPTKLPYGLEPRIDSLLSPAPQDILVQPAPTQ